MKRPITTALFLVTLARAASADDLAAAVFRSSRWRVVLEAPADYRRAGDSPFPGILARFVHKSGATITLAAQELRARMAAGGAACGESTLGRFSADNIDALLRHAYTVVRGPVLRGKACRVTLTPVRGGGNLMQAYLTSGELGYVLTLALPRGTESHADDIEQALELLDITPPPKPKPRRVATPAGGGDQPDMVPRERRYPNVKPWLPGPPLEPAIQEPPLP